MRASPRRCRRANQCAAAGGHSGERGRPGGTALLRSLGPNRFRLNRLSNASLSEGLLLVICFLLVQINIAPQNAAKQRYAIAKGMSRGEGFECAPLLTALSVAPRFPKEGPCCSNPLGMLSLAAPGADPEVPVRNGPMGRYGAG